MALSASSVLIALAGTETATTAFWRCTLALHALAPFLVREVRQHGLPDPRTITFGLLGGAFLGVDFVLWNVSITDVGAGASVVVGAGGGGGGGATGCCGWVVGVAARLTLVGAAARSGSGSTVGSAGGGTTEVAGGAGA